jgi:AcrR family transcriptional regulator
MKTKEKLLIKALELFNEKGIRNTSLREIAAAVGISKPAIYNHFSGKEEMIDELYKYCRERSKNESGESLQKIFEKYAPKGASVLLYEVIVQEQFYEVEAAYTVLEESSKLKEMTYRLFDMLVQQKLLIPLSDSELKALADAYIFLYRGYDLMHLVFAKNNMTLWEKHELKASLRMLIKPYERGVEQNG